MRRFLLTIVIGAFVIVSGAQLYLPPFIGARFAEGLQTATGIESLDVSLHTFPAVRLLSGVVGRLAVSADDVMVDGLRVDSLRLDARNVEVDVMSLVRGDTVSIRRGDDVEVRLTVTAASLTEYARNRPELPSDVSIDVSDRGVELAGRVVLLGNPVDAAVVGRFEPDGHTGVVFVPEDVSVQGQSLPSFLISALRQAYTVRVDLSHGPLPVIVDEVIHGKGKLVVVGRPLLDGFSTGRGESSLQFGAEWSEPRGV